MRLGCLRAKRFRVCAIHRVGVQAAQSELTASSVCRAFSAVCIFLPHLLAMGKQGSSIRRCMRPQQLSKPQALRMSREAGQRRRCMFRKRCVSYRRSAGCGNFGLFLVACDQAGTTPACKAQKQSARLQGFQGFLT